MKKIFIVAILTTTLTGCSTITQMYDAYFMSGYDNVEYSLTNKIRTLSELGVDKCKDPQSGKQLFEEIYGAAKELNNFTQYIPRNTDTHKLSGNMVELAKQGKEMYVKSPNVSETFCKLKLQQVNRSAEMAQKVIGSKPR